MVDIKNHTKQRFIYEQRFGGRRCKIRFQATELLKTSGIETSDVTGN